MCRWCGWLPLLAMLCCMGLLSGCPSTGSGTTCQRNSDCSSGFKCLDGLCGDGKKDSPCKTRQHCLPGFLCIRNQCKPDPTPRQEQDTPDETRADTDAGAEPDELQERKEEIPRERGDGGEIKEDEPELSPDSSGKRSCRVQEDCPSNEVCLVDSTRLRAFCVKEPRDCKRQADCKDTPGSYCRKVTLRSGIVRLLCSYPYDDGTVLKDTGSGCEKDEQCSSGVCLQHSKTCGGFCKVDGDCPSAYYCGTYHQYAQGDWGGCYPRCTNDSDCPDGYQCSSERRCQVARPGQIGSPCRSLKDCGTTAQCVAFWSGGYCLSNCRMTSRLCDADKPCPSGEVCLQSSTSSQSYCAPKCPGTSLCAQFQGGDAFCLGQCQSHQDCRKGYYCAVLGDSSSKVCLPRGQGKLGEHCSTSSDCESGLCQQFANGKYCTQECSTTCPVGYACHAQDGVQSCEKSCLKDSDCLSGFQCLSRRCQIPAGTSNRGIGEACSEDKHCKSGKCLRNNAMFSNGYCSASCEKNACPAGSVCVEMGSEKMCLKSCNPGTGCQRKELFCYPLGLTDPQSGKKLDCSTQNPCPTLAFPAYCHASPTRQFCATGLCLERGTQREGGLCQQDFDCQSGQCYQKELVLPKGASCERDTQCSPSTPYCELTLKQCVQCLSSRDCRLGDCINNVCSTGGFCTSPCSRTNSCNKGSLCSPLNDAKGDSLGSWCLLTCRSSLQCLRDFSCKKQASENVCKLP